MERVRTALDGLSVGDAFGEWFFGPWSAITSMMATRRLPRAPWRYTDDTAMALGIAEVLARRGGIDQDDLAQTFARRYREDPTRGYGGGAHQILHAISTGTPWREASYGAFVGMGSLGNGGAMRVAPVGAYFADDLEAVVAHARASAEVTHAHPEGQAGAIAAAVAAAFAWRSRHVPETVQGAELLPFVLDHTPQGPTRRGIALAQTLPPDTSIEDAVRALGSGYKVTAPDTVPFTLWCAARHLDNYEEALWMTVSGLGDRDTTCAIVGGIVALSAGRESIPSSWLAAREPLVDDPTAPFM
jgi:ADP-ribosylglycohydrolase